MDRGEKITDATIANHNSHWEWEQLGLTFEAWKQQKATQKSEAASLKYVIPGPGAHDYI